RHLVGRRAAGLDARAVLLVVRGEDLVLLRREAPLLHPLGEELHGEVDRVEQVLLLGRDADGGRGHVPPPHFWDERTRCIDVSPARNRTRCNENSTSLTRKRR